MIYLGGKIKGKSTILPNYLVKEKEACDLTRWQNKRKK